MQPSPHYSCGWNSSTHNWGYQQSITDSREPATVFPDKLLCTDGLWRRDSHCLQLCIHWGIHQAWMESLKPIITCMGNAGKKQTKKHESMKGTGRVWSVWVKGRLEKASPGEITGSRMHIINAQENPIKVTCIKNSSYSNKVCVKNETA